jgi:hypothetical protein
VTKEPDYNLSSKANILHTLVSSALAGLFVSILLAVRQDESGTTYLEGIANHLLLPFAVLYLLYVWELYNSDTRRRLSKIGEHASLASSVCDVCMFTPASIQLHVRCSYKDVRGDTAQTVVTHEADHPCKWGQWEDCGHFSGMARSAVQEVVASWCQAQRPLLLIDSTWAVRDADKTLAAAVRGLRAANSGLRGGSIRPVSGAQTAPTVVCEVALKDLRPTAFTARRSVRMHALPGGMSSVAFWCSSLLFLTVPYRVYFARRSRRVSIDFVKAVGGVVTVWDALQRAKEAGREGAGDQFAAETTPM